MKGTDLEKRVFVLVVEDDPLIRLLVSEIISEAGFGTLEAGSADEAIQILESRDDIRIIFTDINMPGSMDGLKLAHAVRDRWPPIKIIVTSGTMQISERHLPVGSRFLRKPYNPEHIVGVLRDLSA